ncbi:hypothetical protein Trydic_g22620 [Trypoxylus dichotomus]
MCGIKNVIGILESSVAEIVWEEAATILRNRCLPKQIITEVLQALIELKWVEKIIILPADKSNAAIVLNIRAYKDVM